MTKGEFVFYYQPFPWDKIMREVYAFVRNVGVWVRLRFAWMGVNREVSSPAETSYFPTGRPGSVVPIPNELDDTRKVVLCTLRWLERRNVWLTIQELLI